jgi:hypothetical protein
MTIPFIQFTLIVVCRNGFTQQRLRLMLRGLMSESESECFSSNWTSVWFCEEQNEGNYESGEWGRMEDGIHIAL